MYPEQLSDADESYLDEVFDRSVRCRATGETLDLESILAGRPHLREHVRRITNLARSVALAEPPSLPRGHAPVLAGFTILEEVGRGGMGIVYRARQESLGRVLALKVLAPSLLGSKHSRERFGVEARALARIRHPNVVTVFEVIEEPEICAYAMEWVDGTTLARAIDSKDPRLEVAWVARLGASIARALVAVHDAGLVHRDVKPGNVLLRQDGTPLLSDFSLVRDEEHSLHTATGEFVGTAAYAAPEQLRGDHVSVGPWTDVYGLGCTLYAALTGAMPFGRAPMPEIMRRVAAGSAPPARKLNPAIPLELDSILAKAMQRDVAARYRTAADLADDLERFLRFERVHAAPSRWLSRVETRLSRHPRVLLSIALAALVVPTGTALWLFREHRPSVGGATQSAERDLLKYAAHVAAAQAALAGDGIVDTRRHLEECPPDLRGWEWRYLRSKLDQGEVVGRHDDPVNTLAVSPDGKRVASGSSDKTLRIWSAEPGSELSRLAHPDPVLCAAWSPDGSLLASVTQTRLSIWDGTTSAPLAQYAVKGATSALGFGPDGALLARADENATVLLHRVGDLVPPGAASRPIGADLPAPLAECRGHANVVHALTFSPAGWLATCSDDGVRIWSTADGSQRAFLPISGNTWETAVHPDGNRLATASNDGIRVWDVARGEEILRMHGHRGRVTSVSWARDGKLLASGSMDRTVRTWTAGGEPDKTLLGHPGSVRRVRWLPGSEKLVSAGHEGFQVLRFDVGAIDSEAMRLGYGYRTAEAVLDPRGRWFVYKARTPDPHVKLGDLARHRPDVCLLHSQTAAVKDVAVSRDGSLLAVAATDGVLLFSGDHLASRVREATGPGARTTGGGRTPKPIGRLDPGAGRVETLAFGRGRTLVAGLDDGSIAIWNGEDLEVRTNLALGGGPVVSAVVDAAGTTLAAASRSGDATVWGLPTGRKIASFTGLRQVSALAYSPDGRYLAIAHESDGPVITLWDRTGSGRERVLSGHHALVSGLAFSPDGSRLASASHDRTVRLWEPSSGQLVATFHDHDFLVTAVQWTGDGAELVSGSGNSTIIFRRAPAPGASAR